MTMRRMHMTCLFALIVTVLPTAAYTSETKEVDVAQAAGLPPMLVGTILTRMKAQAGLTGLPVRLAVKDADGKPAANQEFALTWKGGKETVRTDDEGGVQITITKKNLDGLKLVVPAAFTVEASEGGGGAKVIVQTQISHDAGGKAHTLDLTGMKKLASDGLSVYHAEADRDAAVRQLAELERMRGFIEGFSGLAVSPGYGVVLHRKEGTVTLSGTSAVAIPVQVDDAGRPVTPFIKWALVHEWTELTLMFKTLAYVEDPGLRFVGDGLAELISYEYCRRFTPEAASERLKQYAQRLAGLKKSGATEYDLTKQFRGAASTSTSLAPAEGKAPKMPDADELAKATSPESAAGYAVSFVFWHRLREAHGVDVVRKFIAWFLTAKELTTAKVEAKLAELTGEKCATALAIEPLLEHVRKLRDAARKKQE